MRLKKLLICVMSILMLVSVVLTFTACGGDNVTPIGVDVSIIADNVDNVNAGEYLIPYTITDMDSLVSGHGLVVSIKVTDSVGKDIPVTDGKIIIEEGGTYTVIITAALSDGTATNKTITIKAKRLAVKYKVSFKADGKLIDTIDVKEGDFIPEMTPPDKEGYIFKHWYASNDEKQQKYDSPVKNHLTLIAKYELIEFTATYDANGGIVDPTFEKTDFLKGYKLNPKTPAKQGYTFKFWYLTGDEQKTSIDFTTYTLSKDISLTAEYTKDTYTVTFVYGENNFTKTTDVDRNFLVSDIVDPSLEDSIFQHWKRADGRIITDINAEKYFSDETVTAVFNPIQYAITFILNEQNPTEKYAVTYTQKSFDYKIIQPNAMPKQNDYNFDGWYLLGDSQKTILNIMSYVITKNVTLVAKWSETQYTAIFFDDIPDTNDVMVSTSISKKFKVSEPSAKPDKSGYEFICWYLSTDAKQTPFDFSGTEVKSNIILKAKYRVISISVTFIATNPITKEEFFSKTVTTDIEKNYKVTPPTAVTCEGFTLDFFYNGILNEDDATAFDFTSGVAQGAKFKAKMKTVTYKVDFYDKPSSTGVYSKQHGTDGTYYGVKLLFDIKTWSNYDTLGWVTSESGIGEPFTTSSIITTAMLKDGILRLYASRTPTKYDVKFLYVDEKNIEHIVSERTATINGFLDQTLPTAPNRDYYNFLNWYTMNGTTEKVVNEAYMRSPEIKGNTKIYAKYLRQQCIVEFYINQNDAAPMLTLTKGYDYTMTEADYPTGAPFKKVGYRDNNGIWGRLINGKLVQISPSEKLLTNEKLYLMWEIIEHNITVNILINGENRVFDTTTNILKNNLFSNPEAEINKDAAFHEFTMGCMLKKLYRTYSNGVYSDEFNFNEEQLSADITLYAEYVQATVTLTFYKNIDDTVVIDTLVLPYNSQFKNLPSYMDKGTPTNYTAVGWCFYPNGTTGEPTILTAEYIKNNFVTADLTLYIRYEAVLHKVTLVPLNDNPNIVLTTSFESGYKLIPPTDPSRYGFAFKGWKKGSSTGLPFVFENYTPVSGDIADNIFVYASWEKVIFTMSFTIDGVTTKQEVDYLTDFKIAPDMIPKPTKLGYSFNGWSSDFINMKKFDFTKPLTGNTTVYAMFSLMTFSVTFYYENKTILAIKSATINGIFDMPKTTKLHYTFTGWFDENGKKYDANSQYLTDGIKLYPKFEPHNYTITFDTGIPGIAVPSYYTNIDNGFIVERPMFSVSNKILDGWYLVKNDTIYSEPYNFRTPLSNDTTLYAKWREQTVGDVNFIFEDYYVKTYDSSNSVTLIKFKELIGLTESGKDALDLVVPSVIDGIQIGKIRANAFSGAKARTITIKSNITIGAGAFSNATELESIHITYDGGILGFYDTTFANCLKLTSVHVPSSLIALYAERYTFPNSSLRSSDEFGNELLVYENVTYLLTKDAVYVNSYSKNIMSALVIPNSIYGIPVKYIMDGALQGCNFDSVTLPDTILSLGNYAFFGCERLEEIHIPSSVKEIGSLAFGNCKELQSAYFVSAKAPLLTDLVFSGTTISSIFVPEKLATEYRNAFIDYKDIVKVAGITKTVVIYIINGGEDINTKFYDAETFAENITPVRFGYKFLGWYSDATLKQKNDFTRRITTGTMLVLYAGWELDTTIYFKTKDVTLKTPTGYITEVMIIGLSDHAKAMSTLTIPSMINGKKVRYLHYSALLQSDVLDEIIVAADNEYFISVDGVLFTAKNVNGIKTPNSLVCYPINRRGDEITNFYAVPSGVAAIEQYAFYKNKYLHTVSVPKEVERIGAYTFSESVELRNVNIADKSKLTEIEDGTFSKCKKLDSFKIPELVITIKSAAFFSCINLLTLEFTAKDNPIVSITPSAFYPASAAKEDKMQLNTIILPTGKLAMYEQILNDLKVYADRTDNKGNYIDWIIRYV